MLNCYPLWKYIVLILALVISAIYALPNLYGEDPSIQIVSVHGNAINESTLIQIRNLLEQKCIISKSIIMDNNVIVARFDNSDIQLRAQEILKNMLGENYIIALNVIPKIPVWLKTLGAAPIRLGLDLQGGIHFLIAIDLDTILNKLQEQMIDNLSRDLKEKDIPYIRIRKIGNYSSEIMFHNTENCNKAASWLMFRHRDLSINTKNGNYLLARFTDDRTNQARKSALQQNITILRKRINQLGISESLVQQQGTDHIVIELPGIYDMARAKEILETTATLEFHLVNSSLDYSDLTNGYVPENSVIKNTRDGQSIALYKSIILTGDHIIDAIFSIDEYNRPQVNIILDNFGGAIMSNFTKNNIGKLIATLFIEYKHRYKNDIHNNLMVHNSFMLVKREEIINIATIQSQFSNNFRITGINNPQEARQLSLLLRAGTLIAPIEIVEERIIGPSLGLKNIDQGLQACLWGLISSILFMILWYRKFGLIDAIVLVFNLIIIIGIMSIIPGITLTMPGIVGIVLTLAVAIDSNVLINERIKEELSNSRTVQQAIHNGYLGAFSSIIDANITTLITMIILYIIGTGSIKSFAITTAIGIITSMFTTTIGTRAIVNLVYGNKNIDKLSI